MKEIPLSKGYVARVDDEDYERLSQHRWHVLVNRKASGVTKVYAMRFKRGTKHTKIWMHREIMNTPDGMFTDHIDGDTLNNTRANLRICTASQNMANRVMRRVTKYTTKYQGVLYLDPEIPKYKGCTVRYKAYTCFNKEMIYLGTYATAEEAAKVRDRAVLHYFGEFALLNFPELLEEYKADPYVPREPKRYKPRAPKQSA